MKERYTLEIGGMQLNILTDEKEDYMLGLARLIDSQINKILVANSRSTKAEAYLLCALNYLDKNMKDKLELDEARKRVSELSVENQRLKKELDDKK